MWRSGGAGEEPLVLFAGLFDTDSRSVSCDEKASLFGCFVGVVGGSDLEETGPYRMERGDA